MKNYKAKMRPMDSMQVTTPDGEVVEFKLYRLTKSAAHLVLSRPDSHTLRHVKSPKKPNGPK